MWLLTTLQSWPKKFFMDPPYWVLSPCPPGTAQPAHMIHYILQLRFPNHQLVSLNHQLIFLSYFNICNIEYRIPWRKNVIQISKMQSSVATNLHIFSILFYNKSQKWKILATLGLFWCMQSGYIAGCIQKSVDSSLCLIGLILFSRSLAVMSLHHHWGQIWPWCIKC